MTDLLLDTNNAPATEKGDWSMGYSDEQHKLLLLLTSQGEWKQNPDVGIGPYRFLESENPAALLREVRQQYSADGMEVTRLDYVNGKLNADANYRTV